MCLFVKSDVCAKTTTGSAVQLCGCTPADAKTAQQDCFLFFVVQKIPMFATLSKNIKFQMTVAMSNHKATSFMEVLERVFAICNKREFAIAEIQGDSEFQVLKPWLDNQGVAFNAATKGKHVLEIGQQFCFNKDKL